MKYLLLAFLFAGCAQQTPSAAVAINHKTLVSHTWDATGTGTVPFARLILAGDTLNASGTAEVLADDSQDGCNSSIYIQGDDNSGSISVSTSDPSGDSCREYNGEIVNYTRIDDLTIKFCTGSICGTYQ